MVRAKLNCAFAIELNSLSESFELGASRLEGEVI